MLAAGLKQYREQQHISALAVRQLLRSRTLADALRLLAIYQATAALSAAEWSREALREQDLDTSGATLVPAAFTVSRSGPSVLELAETERQFGLIVSTLVSDAGRSAAGAYTASRAEQYGNIRQLTPPSCSRCAILAGRFYRWSDGFRRHPGCDCTMVPGKRDSVTWDPYKAFDRGEIGSYRTLPDGTRRFESGLSKSQIAAVEDGADIAQVVNAQRGTQVVNFSGRTLRVTTEGTTSRGMAFRKLSERGGSERVPSGFTTVHTRNGPEQRLVHRDVARAPRLTPEQIYRLSGADRQEAIRLLKANGYIT